MIERCAFFTTFFRKSARPWELIWPFSSPSIMRRISCAPLGSPAFSVARGAYAEVSEEETKAIQEFFEKCPEGYHVDHKIPLSRGGSHTLDNLQYMTEEANLRKHMLTQEEWEIKAKEKGWDVGVLENNS